MKTLEMDIKKSLDCLYKNSDKNSIYVFGSQIVTRDQMIEILEIKLLKILNFKGLYGSK